MKRTLARVDAIALRFAIDAHYGYPRRLDESELVRIGGQQAGEVWTTTAVALSGDGDDVDVTLDDGDLAHVADATLRARVLGARRPERERLPATGLSPVSGGARMAPVVLLANVLALPPAIEKSPGEIHVLWDVSCDTPTGVRYVREDGQREFFVQPVAEIGAQYVAILWSAGRDDDPGEAAYIAEMLAVAIAGGLVAEYWSCSRASGLWAPQGLGAEVLAAWPAEWHSAGTPCVGPPT